MFSLKGKTALVTGGGRGIGKAIAEALVTQGARVYISGRTLQTLEQTAKNLDPDNKGCVIPLAFDVTDKAGIHKAMGTITANGFGLDILVNNAGINLRGPLESISEELWDEVINTNLKSLFLISQAAFPLLKQKGGKIINIASLMSEIGRPTIAPYGAAKGGVRQLTKAMAVEWAEHNIQANAIAPGYIATDMNVPLMNNEDFNTYLMRRIPAKRWGDTKDIGAMAAFLASDTTSYITGQIFFVDGGLMASL